MPWGAAVAAVAGAYGASQQKKGAKGAANAQEAASMAAIEEQRRQFDIMQNNLAPWMNTGKWALDKQQAFLNGDVTGFENSPDYLWANQQGLNTLDQSAASRGGLFGGGHSKDVIKFGQGNAQQYANSYWDKISGLSGTGNSTATNLGNAGMNMANQIGAQYNNIGNARASMYQSNANTNAQLGYGLGGMFNNWYQNNLANNPGGTGWYLGNNPGRG